MMRIGVKTKLSPDEVIQRASQFFGPDQGYGLKITDQDETHICLEGGGGSVDVLACAGDDGTDVDLVSTEWDAQLREFIEKIR
jgi:hypothetical protein